MLPLPFGFSTCSSLEKFSYKILADFLGTAQRFTVDHENGNRFRATKRNQLFLILGILANVLLSDLIFAAQVGHAIQHALGKAALIVEIKFQLHIVINASSFRY